MRYRPIVFVALLSYLLFLPNTKIEAQELKPSETIQSASDAKAAEHPIKGPAKIALHEQATLDLPIGFVFIPEKPAREIMRKSGNQADADFIGLIFPIQEDVWDISVEYVPSGYIGDDDAKTMDADKLLKNIERNTEIGNKKRIANGLAPIEAAGWVEKPHYDSVSRRLIWSIAVRDKGNTDDTKNIVNYRTLMLGREGYIDMTMVTDQAKIEEQKSIANLLLSDLNFETGKRYTDFNSKTDKIAEYGLGALIVGVAAKKLGLMALAIAFVAKFAKIAIVMVIAFFVSVRRKLRRAKPVAPVSKEPPKPDAPG